MVRSIRGFGAALIAMALASTADAQTPMTLDAATPTLHARARHHKHHVVRQEPEGRQITVHKSAGATPSWLTLGTDAPVGTGNNYVTSTFDQPSPIEGTFAGYRGRERLQYAEPGLPLFRF